MQRVEQHIIDKKDTRYTAIDAAAYASKNLYNAALYEIRQAFIKEGKYCQSVSIRPARKTDAGEAVILIKTAIEELANVLTGMEHEAAVLLLLEQFFQAEVNRLSYHNAIVKELDGHLAGIIVVYHGRDVEQFDRPIIEHLQRLHPDRTIILDAETAPDEFYIDTLSVSPQYSGQGIGTALIQAAEQRARYLEYPKITLNVHIDNVGAYRLYVRSGYHITKDIQIDGAFYHHMLKEL